MCKCLAQPSLVLSKCLTHGSNYYQDYVNGSNYLQQRYSWYHRLLHNFNSSYGGGDSGDDNDGGSSDNIMSYQAGFDKHLLNKGVGKDKKL